MACFLTRRSRSPRALRENTGSKYTLYALSDRKALTTVIITGKGFFYMLVVYRDVVTANETNGIVIVPKASGTLNHRSYGHIPILTIMTWFRGLFLNDSF